MEDLDKRVKKLEIVVGMLIKEMRETLSNLKELTKSQIKSLDEQEAICLQIKDIIERYQPTQGEK